MAQGQDRPAADASPTVRGSASLPPAGHRVVRSDGGTWIEAWAPELAACLTEALGGLVEATGGVVPDDDAPSYDAVPLSAGPARPPELLVALFEEVLGVQQVLSFVPVRFHLAATEDGGVAGDMEVARQRRPRPAARPGAVSRDGLTIAQGPEGWRCRVRLVL